MVAPVAIDVPKGAWKKIATAVTAGNVWIVEPRAVYSHYYVPTGGSAPTDMDEAAPMPEPGLPISCDEKCDIYIYCGGVDGKVVVAL